MSLFSLIRRLTGMTRQGTGVLTVPSKFDM
jgi:hypothetical protein